MSDPLAELRGEIDRCDAEIVRLLNARCRISQKIGEYKKSRGISIRDAGRENELWERLQALNRESGPLPEATLREIYQLVLRASRELQS